MKIFIDQIKLWAKVLKKEVLTLWFCQKHPDIPLLAKILSIFIVAYAFSPIDLIPDFIPILGLLDDIIIIPICIHFTLRLIPKHVIDESRAKANEWIEKDEIKPKNWFVALIIILIWLFVMVQLWMHFVGK